MPDNEKDTSSLITTGARSFPVFDDTGDYAGSAQTFGQERSVEQAAIEAAMNPQSNTDAVDFDALCAAMLEKEMVWCHGRCQTFKHKSLFSTDERNIERLQCHVYCKECRARMDYRKRTALLPHDVQAQQRYEYRQRKAKKRKRR